MEEAKKAINLTSLKSLRLHICNNLSYYLIFDFTIFIKILCLVHIRNLNYTHTQLFTVTRIHTHIHTDSLGKKFTVK